MNEPDAFAPLNPDATDLFIKLIREYTESLFYKSTYDIVSSAIYASWAVCTHSHVTLSHM